MKKRQRILGAVIMGVALFLGLYVGGWLLFVKALMNIEKYVTNSQGGKIWIELLKIFGGFPMLMSLVYPMWEIGKMIFFEK